MNIHKLSKRLKTVADYIPQNSRLADIGSDHAYLPCFAAVNGIITYSIAGEVNEGPYLSALSQVKSSQLEHVIDVRKGNGLAVITPHDQIEVITICGMGGDLIQQILSDGRDKLSAIKRLILQPNVSAIHVRTWLLENGWEITSESILEEDEKIYEIVVAEKGDSHRPYGTDMEIELLLGPFLLKEKNSAFFKKWKHEIEGWRKISKQLELSKTKDAANQRKIEIDKKISMVEEALQI